MQSDILLQNFTSVKKPTSTNCAAFSEKCEPNKSYMTTFNLIYCYGDSEIYKKNRQILSYIYNSNSFQGDPDNLLLTVRSDIKNISENVHDPTYVQITSFIFHYLYHVVSF